MATVLKNVKRDISTIVWLILVKFECWCSLALPTWLASENLKFWKSKMVVGGHLEVNKSRYIQHRLADLLWNFVW